MTARRQLRAGTAPGAAESVIPLQLLRFDLADWPPARNEPDVLTGTGEHAAACALFFARRRWYAAQRRWCEANDMTTGQLRQLAAFKP